MNNQIEMEMAGFGPRFGAFLIDRFIFLVVIILFFKSTIYTLKSNNIESSEIGDAYMIGGIMMYFIGMPLLMVLYQSIFEASKYQGTPGKIAVKIKVVNKHASRISFMKALVRNLGKVLSEMMFFIGFLLAIWTNEKQALHDLFANTYVILDR